MYSGPRKLYIDSRYRSSGTHNDFTFQLAQSIEVPHGFVAVVDTVSVPNVFQTVDATRNKLYVELFEQPDQVLTLTTGMYNGVTLAAELQAQLNAMGHGTYTVVYNTATLHSAYSRQGSSTCGSVRGRRRAPSMLLKPSGL